MELATHPLVCGTAKRTGLFWFSISPLLTDTAHDSPVPVYLRRPETILDRIWALPDRTLRSLSDVENAATQPSKG